MHASRCTFAVYHRLILVPCTIYSYPVMCRRGSLNDSRQRWSVGITNRTQLNFLFETFAYRESLFLAIPRHLNFMCRRFRNTAPKSYRRFGTVCPDSVVQCSETSAHEIQPRENRPKESLQYTFISLTNQVLKMALVLNCGHWHIYAIDTDIVRQASCACIVLLKTVTYHECGGVERCSELAYCME
jgi:hypothetical protein